MPDSSEYRANANKPPLPLLPADCPVCDAEGRPWHSVGGYPIYECLSCHHRFVPGRHAADHLSANFTDDYFFGGGAGYPDYLADSEILRDRGHRYGRILARFRQPGRVLDVGSAAGFILRGLMDCGWSGRGLEPNRTMAAYARDHLGLAIDCTGLEDHAGDETYDLVTMFQSVMHFYDVRRACEVAARLTRPGGHWLIEAFNPHSWTGRLLGKRWHDYNPPSVLHWFSPQSLTQLARQYGLQPVAIGRAPKSISAAHAKSVLDLRLNGTVYGRLLRPALKLVPDRLRIPYPGDDIFWALFTKPAAESGAVFSTGEATGDPQASGRSTAVATPPAAAGPLRLLPPALLVKTGPVDKAEWNSRFILGWISRQRFHMALALLPKGRRRRLLEIGYGSGVFLPALHERTSALFGIDIHDRNADVERSLARINVKADLYCGDSSRLPFPDGYFDAVVGVSCFEFIEDLDRAMQEVCRTMAPDGAFVAILPAQSKLIDAGFRLLTGKDPEEDFRGRRQRVGPTLLRYFLAEEVRFWPPRPAIPLYTAYRLRPKPAFASATCAAARLAEADVPEHADGGRATKTSIYASS